MPAVTLEQLLESRDRRAAHQKDLLGAHPGKSLLCMTVQLPGPEKRNALSLTLACAGVEAIRAAFPAGYEELRDLETGYEAYFLLSMPAEEVKRQACQLEDTHPLGRLLDLDVLAIPGQTGNLQPLSRSDIGLPPRKCLLCEQPARYCMRAHTHSREALLARIEQMIRSYGISSAYSAAD